MFKRPMPKPKAQRGISLVEVMVGMAIGLLASLVIFKAFTSSETFRRNVGGAADTVQTAAVVGARLNLMLEEGGAGLVRPLGAPDSGFAGGGDVGRYFD